MSQFRLLYRSRATGPQDYASLTALLARAGERNERAGVTGLLCYGRGHFFQCLEGPRGAVSATVGRIYHDPRHADIVLFDARVVPTRLFPDWGMKLVLSNEFPAEGELDADGLLAFLTRSAAGAVKASAAPGL